MSWKEFGSESRPSPDESFRIGTTAHALPTGSLVLRRLSLDLFRSILRSLNFSSTASTRHMCTAASAATVGTATAKLFRCAGALRLLTPR
jgi:hypothetical protein